MSNPLYDFEFDVNYGFGSDSLLSENSIESAPSPPPSTSNFLLLDGSDFLLLDGSNLLLL